MECGLLSYGTVWHRSWLVSNQVSILTCTLKIEAAGFYEPCITLYKTLRYHNPESHNSTCLLSVLQLWERYLYLRGSLVNGNFLASWKICVEWMATFTFPPYTHCERKIYLCKRAELWPHVDCSIFAVCLLTCLVNFGACRQSSKSYPGHQWYWWIGKYVTNDQIITCEELRFNSKIWFLVCLMLETQDRN